MITVKEISEKLKKANEKIKMFFFGKIFRGMLIAAVAFCVLLSCVNAYSQETMTVSVASAYESFSVTLCGEATVADVLAESGVDLQLTDRISQPISSSVSDKEVITAEYSENPSLALPAAAAINTITDLSQLGTLVMTSSGHIYEYSECITAEATAYCSCSICCGSYDGGSTADGSVPQAGYTVAAPSAYAFGTMFYIPEFDNGSYDGVFEVEDRGGAITNNRIDIYFNTHSEALRFGRRHVTVYILK